MLKRYLKNDEGAAAVVFALTIPLIIGGITLAVELGHWNQNKSKLQDLADVTAKAAAFEIQVLGDDAKYELAGKGHAFENGFEFSNTNTVTVVSPPLTGKYAGKDAVEVTLREEQPMYFAKYFGNKSFTLETTATAMVLSGVPACILSLSPTAGPAFSVSGSATIDVNGCGVHTNSTSPDSVSVGSKDNFTADCLSSSGGITAGPGTNLTQCDSPDDYARTLKDPYADVAITDNVNAMPCLKPTKRTKFDLNLVPGRYCKNVAPSGGIYLTQPGTYYFDAADVSPKSQYAYVYGRGVTLVFMNGGTFNNANGGMIDLTAPTSGTFAGIVFFFDPDTTPAGGMKINGNQNSRIEGVFYAPTVDLQFNGGMGSVSTCTQVVANTVILNGNASFTNQNCEALGVKQIGGETGVALVE